MIDKKRAIRNATIMPMVDGHYIHLQLKDICDISFIFDPKKGRKSINRTLVQQIMAKSYYGYHGLFKPSVAEVINCIPDDLLSTVTSFEIDKDFSPRIVQDISPGGRGYHLFSVNLYKNDRPEWVPMWLWKWRKHSFKKTLALFSELEDLKDKGLLDVAILEKAIR